MFDALGPANVGFEDFRKNGLLLPASEEAAIRLALPLHRGPHREYNELVIEQVGSIERSWSVDSRKKPRDALEEALERLDLLQRALRKRLLADQRRLVLNRKDPIGTGFDFTELDAMAEQLWKAT